jgi:hypothetical protein
MHRLFPSSHRPDTSELGTCWQGEHEESALKYCYDPLPTHADTLVGKFKLNFNPLRFPGQRRQNVGAIYRR